MKDVQKAARRRHIESLTDELLKLDALILRAKKYVNEKKLREFTREEVELMRERASKRSTRFAREVLKPLDFDLKRREHDKRKKV